MSPRRILAIIVLAATVLMTPPPGAHAAPMLTMRGTLEVRAAGATAPAPLRMRVEVSYKGFDGEPALHIEAAVGQEIEITFVWADQAVPDNAHRIYISGYELKTSLLTEENPEDTLSFVAERGGEFDIACDWRCEGHKEALQAGRFIVAGAGGPVGFAPALLTLTSPGARIGPLELTATLADPRAGPIEGARVRFLIPASLAGVSGMVEIGAATTDADGVARIEYAPPSAREILVVARFDGTDLRESTESVLRVNAPEGRAAFGTQTTPLEQLAPWTRLGLGLLLLGIWATFVSVIRQVIRIRRESVPVGGRGREEP